MRKLKLWIIPAIFYIVCAALNLVGCLTDGHLERIMKPSLLPLICVSTLGYLLSRGVAPGKKVALLTAAQLCGFAGDTMLIGKGFAFFAGGIGFFLLGHIFYMCLFGGISWKGMKPWQWIAAIAGSIAAATTLALIIGVNGVMLAPMGIYALALMMLIFSGLAGVLRIGGATWWIILIGALLFTFSDTLIAIRNFGTLSPFMDGFGVMSTYLIAQSLLAVGGIRLCLAAERANS